MSRTTLVPVVAIALACGSGARTQSSSSSAEADLAAALAQSGLLCAPRQPPKVLACAGKQAGDACQVIDDEGTGSGTCQTLRDGRLACNDDDMDGGERDDMERRDGGDVDRGDAGVSPPPFPLTAACMNKSAGDSCSVEFDGQSFGTNVMEGVLVTLLKERGLPPTEENYLKLLGELGWQPRITDFAPNNVAAASPA